MRDFKIRERKSCPLNRSNDVSSAQQGPEEGKAWVWLLWSKKIMEFFFFFFPGNKKLVQHVPGEENKGCYFFLNDSSGFWNWAQQVGRACIDFKRYLNVTQTLSLWMSSTKCVSSFLYFFLTKNKTFWQKKKKKQKKTLAILASVCLGFTVRKERFVRDGSWGLGRANLSVYSGDFPPSINSQPQEMPLSSPLFVFIIVITVC